MASETGKRVLITGGAGFIGSHLADELLEHGYRVRILDNLIPPRHDPGRIPPAYLNPDAEFICGDVRDGRSVRRALHGMDAAVHLAAAVGLGQSMYEIEKYTSVNNLGTAVFLQAVLDSTLSKVVVASSMSIYGEGQYRAIGGRSAAEAERSLEQLKAAMWEVHDRDGLPLEPVPTPESKAPALASIYALTKYDQECMCLLTGRAYNIPTVALRFFNIYGPRQVLANPYSGMLTAFAARCLARKPPLILEDGYQKRDFLSVRDAARACRLALENAQADHQVFNIGSGRASTVRDVVGIMAGILQRRDLEPVITGRYRVGDIRHCFADISAARAVLGFEPQISLERGLEDMLSWLTGQIAGEEAEFACREMDERGLML